MPPSPPASSARRSYPWLPLLIVGMTIVAFVIGVVMLRSIEVRMVEATGENLTLAASEIADKLDRLLFERHGDVRMLARALSGQPLDKRSISEYLKWMKSTYAPVYLWLGVTDSQGRMVAATDQSIIGQDYGRSGWFEGVRQTGAVRVDEVETHEPNRKIESIAFTSPIVGAKGEFLGVVTTRIGLQRLEEVLTETIREIQQSNGAGGPFEYQFLTKEGVIFVDSTLSGIDRVNLKQAGLPSAVLSGTGKPGYVEEEHARRHVPVVTGYARTKGYNDYPGFQWTILLRMDRDVILLPIRAMMWKLGIAGVVVWLPMVGLLLWATGQLRREYRQAQQESEWARAAEAALLQSQERNRVIVDTALDAVISMDAAGIITDWNAQAANIFGWQREEALGHRVSETVIPPRDREAHEQGLRHFLETGEGAILNRRIEMLACHRDGHEFPVEITISPARLGDAYIFSAFVRDITARKRTERQLASQYAVTRVLAESRTLEEAGPKILQAICESLEWELGVFWRLDRQGSVLRCLEVWQSPGLNAEEFVLATWQHAFALGKGLPGRIWQGGQPTWIMDVAQESNFPRADTAAKVGLHGAFGFPVRVGTEVEGVIELFRREIKEPDEQLLKMVADVGLKIGQFGERARAEDALRCTEVQLQQSQKMEAVGRLAGGVAHDFNNMLTVIRGYSELVLSRLAPTDGFRKELEEVKKAADRASGLTGQLLAFSRRQFIAPKVLDLNAVIHNMEGMLRRLLGEDIVELCTVLDPDVGQLKADPGQVEQVIMNLAVNARDAMPSGGRLTVETSNVQFGNRRNRPPMGAEPGSYIALVVRDTGHGMDEETQSHIFEPFFTTKEKGKGTGLGLSTVYGIVKQSGGFIEVESKPGRGATFKIFFPRVDGAAQGTESVAAGGDPIKGRETVLLVEDEPGVRRLVNETLRLHGYTVLEARHGIEALLTGAKHLGPIHLLLTDVVMPQMSGPEVAEKLATVRPEVKVLYMSGYPDHPAFSKGGVDTEHSFLQKPFTPSTLAQKVREVLDGSKVA
ncbi:MAG: PAS/PAC sensor hybrid histidine kinase [Nitrospira sp.]|nr:MAG: PAS/PAC sensor hybrid histidine kinase [Nitrospira sp.]